MSMATVSLLMAIQMKNKALSTAGRHPLSKAEKMIVLQAGYNKIDLSRLESDLDSLPDE